MDNIFDYAHNSMLYWYPRLKKINNIKTPKSMFVLIDKDDEYIFRDFTDEKFEIFWTKYQNKFYDILELFQYPVFIKTDYNSYSDQWKNTCCVISENVLKKNIKNIILKNNLVDKTQLPINAFAIREIIPFYSTFIFFDGDEPISKDRWYFINNGQVVCHHTYWIDRYFKNMFEKYTNEKSVPHKYRMKHYKRTMTLVEELNAETKEEIETLSNLSLLVGTEFKGYYAIHYAQDICGNWWIINIYNGNDVHSRYSDICNAK